MTADKGLTPGSLSNLRVLSALNGIELFGHERGNIEVYKALRRMGAKVTVGVNAMGNGGAVADELEREAFSTFVLPFGPQWSLKFVKRHPYLVLSNPLAVIRCSAKFRKAIRTFRPTHIHLGSPLAYSYLFLALTQCSIPVVYRMGDCPPRESVVNLGIWRFATRRATRVVANSQFVKAAAIDAGVKRGKVDVIYNVAPSVPEPRNGHGRVLKPVKPGRLVYAGAVTEMKGLLLLVDAVGSVASVFPDVTLDILGESRWDGNFRDQLMERICALGVGDRITFHGHVADPSEYLRAASVHVAPSLWEEAGSNVVVEAKREGTPSVVFPSGGLSELIRHGIDGYSCSDKTSDALADGIRWLLSDSARLSRMRLAAREDYESRFGSERFALEWKSVYEAVLGAREKREDD